MRKVPPSVRFPLLILIVALTFTRGYPQSTTPPLGHVVIVALENHSYGDVVGNSSMPYYNSLIQQYGLAQNFFANVHGSFPDYAMLTSGELITANGGGLPDDFPISIDNIERELIAAGMTWKVYAEDLPSVGYTGGDSGLYLKRHNPFAYMSDNLNGAAQANNIVPFTQFAIDLSNNALPNFSFIIPNAADDSEDCPGGGSSCSDSTKLANADQWLQANIQPLLTNPAFQQDGLLVLWWDEGNAADTSSGGGRVPVTLVGPTIKSGFQSSTFYRHENVLRTIAEGMGLGFPGASTYVPSMAEFFGPRSTQPGAITGQVTDSSTATPVVGATLSYSGGSTTTDTSGNYTLTNVSPGSITVTASASGYTSASSTVSVTSGNTATLNFQLNPVPVNTPGTIQGRVTNISTGGAAGGATVSFSGGSTTADSNGNYSFSNVAPGTYSLTASHTGYFNVIQSVTVVSGATSTLNFALATGGKIAGTITNSGGTPISGAAVTITGGVITTTVNTTTNSSGGYNSNWVPIGSYTVTVSASGRATQSKGTTATTGATTTLNFILQ
ncbi:MAG TPA: carboxypeptidase regulatory-like domain-containing protein [Bryobacteraceae bacterium]|nr:carboxypeptidase regulatory-like domain-containing protein [Bryobacteraceae bacterium]